MPLIRLVAGGDDRPLGWLLGYPIDIRARRLAIDGEELAVPDVGSDEAIETFIYAFGGRFLVILLAPGRSRIYLAASGAHSAVYCPRARIVASTPGLVPRNRATGDRVNLARAIGIPFSNAMYPLGLTPRFGIDRLLPNHYLDLVSWRAIRHWPSAPLFPSADVDGAVADIAETVKSSIAAVIAAGPVRLALTAGRDSRMLLACAKDVRDSLEAFTLEIGKEGARVDCEIASRIADRFRLKHCVLPAREPGQRDLDAWMARIGYSTGEYRGWRSATTTKQLGHPERLVLKGVGGGLERAIYWQIDDTETTAIPPERLLHHCLCPPCEEPLARAREWLRSVPAVDSLQI
ncbi:MAG TPA: hypothetical protein VES39_06815, partial [Rhodospirillales bacterium]|nr:hypothetical protein [Rhodospirillales bacterium]